MHILHPLCYWTRKKIYSCCFCIQNICSVDKLYLRVANTIFKILSNFRQEDNDCKLLTMAELQLVNFIRKRQAFRWKNHQKTMLYTNLLYISISSILVILIIMSALLFYFPKKSSQHCFFWTIFYYGHFWEDCFIIFWHK